MCLRKYRKGEYYEQNLENISYYFYVFFIFVFHAFLNETKIIIDSACKIMKC